MARFCFTIIRPFSVNPCLLLSFLCYSRNLACWFVYLRLMVRLRSLVVLRNDCLFLSFCCIVIMSFYWASSSFMNSGIMASLLMVFLRGEIDFYLTSSPFYILISLINWILSFILNVWRLKASRLSWMFSSARFSLKIIFSVFYMSRVRLPDESRLSKSSSSSSSVVFLSTFSTIIATFWSPPGTLFSSSTTLI